jgi:hypothetical protein
VEWKILITVLVVLSYIVKSLFQRSEAERGSKEPRPTKPYDLLAHHLAKEEERRSKQPRPPIEPERPPADKPPRRASNDIERFLEEVNRRRRPPSAAAQPARPSLRSQVRPQSLSSQPAPRARADQAPVAAEPVVAIAVTAGPVAPARPAAVVKVESVFSNLAPFVSTTVPSAAPRPGVEQLVALLRSPQTLRTAVMLREIFDAPRCRRRPGRSNNYS